MIITQTPLRISFLGGNTDFLEFYKKYGGCVLTSAIDKFVYCTIHKRFDDKIYVSWSKKEIVDDISQIEHELVREAMKKTRVKKGVEISFYADIPSEGSGLGSSSSVTVGVLNALYQYIGKSVPADQLAREACEIEIDILKKPIGIQDQYIAAYGGLNFLEFQKNGKVKSNKININHGIIDDFDSSLMLFYTGMTRKSGQILTEVKQNVGSKTKILLENKKMAYEAYEALLKGDIERIGELLDAYWQLKKKMGSGVTNEEIELMYQKAKKAGAIGGKIAGAGGGGFMILMVPSNKRKVVREALKNYREMPFRIDPDGSKVILNCNN